MSLELNQQLQPVMQVKVTPKQIAANYILQMSSVALQEAIAQELDENPALEMQELPTCPICGSPVAGNYCTECMPRKGEGEGDETRLSADDLGGDGQTRLRDEEDEFDPIARAEADFTLEDHLTWNLHALLPTRLHHVADHVIGALDSNGFLTESDADIASETGVLPEDVGEVLAAMKGLEPIGIGSRSITESLLAQVEYLREQNEIEVPPYAEEVIGQHLADLGERRFREVASSVGCTQREVIAVWEFVKANLNPYPTAAFTAAVSGDSSRPIIRPDVLIRDIDGELAVEVVESRRFSLRVAPIYSSLSSKLRSAETTEADKEHVRQYVGRAKFFIDNINRRRATIQRIAEALVDRQRDYLVNGVQHLVPLTRAEVGELIGMHESTVSRATAEKYVMIPSGEVVPFSHFFTASLGIKDQIKRMIEAEDPKHPLSDQEIADALGEDGIALARRTVAKYRDELQILPARLRHR
ncbi:MAG TPA: RNA polymerase factor sigma-54 [Candidatus Limnocylindria bacterium]|jgi:RNA polymerase sigma-54 factor|nr:RNA polymerase factor sigma-54 [Candidatus Limnocylindria bacterium]